MHDKADNNKAVLLHRHTVALALTLIIHRVCDTVKGCSFTFSCREHPHDNNSHVFHISTHLTRTMRNGNRTIHHLLLRSLCNLQTFFSPSRLLSGNGRRKWRSLLFAYLSYYNNRRRLLDWRFHLHLFC